MPVDLFDVDGTLVDTNYLHAVTWWEVFARAGHVVPMTPTAVDEPSSVAPCPAEEDRFGLQDPGEGATRS